MEERSKWEKSGRVDGEKWEKTEGKLREKLEKSWRIVEVWEEDQGGRKVKVDLKVGEKWETNGRKLREKWEKSWRKV